jgi:hypothetical protein
MHLANRLALAAALSITASAALAQDNAVVLFDATRRNVSCVIPDLGAIPPSQSCAAVLMQGFLVQGQRNQLRIVRRKFLTRYSFFVDKVTPIQNFPIEDLNEAANLTTPIPSSTAAVSKGVAPKGLATSGSLTLRSAQDLIAELLNPATSSNPVSELASDWVVVKREAENVRNDARAFQATWMSIQGPAMAVDEHACRPAYGAPTLTSVRACLNAQWTFETSGTFDDGLAIYSDEDKFRTLIVRDNDAIAMVTLLGSVLAQQTPALSNQLSAFDGDLASLRADMNTLAGNMQAMQDALGLLESMTREMTKAQIKLRLIQALNGGTKPVLDDAELNRLTDEYYRFMQTGAGRTDLGRTRSAIRLLWLEGLRQANETLSAAQNFAAPLFNDDRPCPADEVTTLIKLGCLADKVDARYSSVLEQDHLQLKTDLPDYVASINALQSKLLARANEIYDKSQVAVALDRPIDLGGQSGNLRVYFTLYETETFPRFAMPSSLTASSVVAATPVTVTNPTPPAPATTATTTPPQPSGTPVTSGVLEVHDRYKATMVAAFAFSPGVSEISIKTNTVTTGMATGSTAQNPIPCTVAAPCTQVLTTGPIHSSVILGMSFHPGGYDTFPGAFSWNQPRKALKQAVGIFGGLSVQNLNDYYFGADLQIAHGLQFMGGLNFFRQGRLAPGFTSGGIYPGTPSFTGAQQWTHGGYFGLGLNLSIFRKAFGSVTGLGTKTASSGS